MKRNLVKLAVLCTVMLLAVSVYYAQASNNVAIPTLVGNDKLETEKNVKLDKSVELKNDATTALLYSDKNNKRQPANDEVAIKVRQRVLAQIEKDEKEKATLKKTESKKAKVVEANKKPVYQAKNVASKPVEKVAYVKKTTPAKKAEKPKPAPKATAAPKKSNSERELLIAIVDVEASSESYEAKLAVANVILNRIKYGWGSTIREVVYARGQFPPAHNGVLDKRLASGPWSSQSARAVDAALGGHNNIGTAQSFNMYYGQKLYGTTKIIDGTIFYNFR